MPRNGTLTAVLTPFYFLGETDPEITKRMFWKTSYFTACTVGLILLLIVFKAKQAVIGLPQYYTQF